MLEKLHTLEVPEWAVCAIEYGDFSGLTEDEIGLVQHFIDTEIAGQDWEWGAETGFARRNDLGGLACNVVELNILHEVTRRASDPTRMQMLRAVLRQRWVDRDDKFAIEAALYWFASHWHSGQFSNLYSAVSTSPYRPGPLCNGLEGGLEQIIYDFLVDHFCPVVTGPKGE